MDLKLLKKYIEHSRNFYYQNPKNYNIILNNQIPEYNTEPIKKGKFIYITFADALRNQEGNNRIVNAKKLKIRINNNKLIDEFIVYNLKDVDANFKRKFRHLLTNKKYFAWICKVITHPTSTLTVLGGIGRIGRSGEIGRIRTMWKLGGLGGLRGDKWRAVWHNSGDGVRYLTLVVSLCTRHLCSVINQLPPVAKYMWFLLRCKFKRIKIKNKQSYVFTNSFFI